MKNNNKNINQIYRIRHSLAHILASALQNLFPNTKLGTGPAIENGFYYDVENKHRFSSEDFKKIEQEMRRLINQNLEFERQELTIKEAKKNFKKRGENYKIELIEKFAKSGSKKVSIYTTGNFIDLCEGGHIKNTKEIPIDAFALSHISGTYWQGNENNPQLQRIYGLAFDSKDKLKEYQKFLEEAKKRDHRKLGEILDLFTFSDKIGAGLPLWTPKGTLLRELIIDKIQSLQSKYGFNRVTIPHITKKTLYEISGHWEKFGNELFKVKGASDQEFVIKPMNCPHHTQIYDSKPRSYKDLPLRYMETTMVYRDEQAGELLGISRTRSISQDDGHIFCDAKDIKQEIKNIVNVIKEFYKLLNLFNNKDCWVSISIRDKKTPEKYLGDDSNWNKAEKILENIAKQEKLNYKIIEGEAAFYGPKIDFIFRDAIGREWQLATIQLDFVMPKRFKLEYTDINGVKKTPVMIHRAIAGSIERFLSVMIEHFAGAFPFWLSPTQIQILPISEKSNKYAENVKQKLLEKNYRVEINKQKETLNKKIRQGEMQKIPYLMIIGEKEQKNKTINIREHGKKYQKEMKLNEFINSLNQ